MRKPFGYELRRLAWKALSHLPEFRMTLRTRHGVIGFSNRDRGTGRILFFTREFEYDKIQHALASAADLGALRGRQRGWLIDVGAHVGTVCIAMVRERVFPKAIAIEPEPRNYRHLLANVAANRLGDDIRCFQVAVSSRAGTLPLELAPRNRGDYRLRLAAPIDPVERFGERGRTVIQVPVRRLDDLVAEAGLTPADVGLLWMDVQGHEPHALEGASCLLATGVPVVIEFWPYAIRRAGVIPERFVDGLTERFALYVDLNATRREARPTSTLRDLLGSLSHYKNFTDLLLIPGDKR